MSLDETLTRESTAQGDGCAIRLDPHALKKRGLRVTAMSLDETLTASECEASG